VIHTKNPVIKLKDVFFLFEKKEGNLMFLKIDHYLIVFPRCTNCFIVL